MNLDLSPLTLSQKGVRVARELKVQETVKRFVNKI